MLTYRTGAAGASSAAKAMSEHLLQQTLSPEMAVMAEYYAQGLSPPTPAAAAAARYAGDIVGGRLPTGAALDALVDREIERLAEMTRDGLGGTLPRAELAVRALSAFVAAGLIDRSEAVAALGRAGHDAGDDPGGPLPGRLDAAILVASTGKDHSSATATPRRDMNPALATRLGIDTARALTPDEIAHLLNGQRADGGAIAGKQLQAATDAIGSILGFDTSRLPTRAELAHVLAGRRADGGALPPEQAARAVRRFQTVLGATQAEPTAEQRAHLLAGRTASGAVLTPRQYHARMDTARARIGYVDLTFSAPKSISVAWAFAPTEAERGIIHQAHRDAVTAVMREIECQIGRARKGKAGRDGWEPGSIGWVSFDHYTSRPTVAVIRQDRDGQDYTELHTLKRPAGRVAGDMQLHTHTAVFNAVLTPTGRIGGLDLAQLEGRVKEWGALYQAYLATHLRRHGVEMELDTRTGMARAAAVPEAVTAHFSKRTLGGTEAARAYAAAQGLDWDALDADRKVGLLKQGVQNPRGAKSDDLSDAAAWARAAAEIRYRHRSILRPDDIPAEPSREARLEAAYQAALPLLDQELQRRAALEGGDARVAAAKGLIASGVVSPSEVDDITRAFRMRGVRQHGEDTALVWGTTKTAAGRDTIGITTALHVREERALVAHAQAAAQDRGAALTPTQIAAAVARFPDLDFSSPHGRAQRDVMERLGTGGRLGVAIGVAGSGKSTLLRPLVRAWQDEGRTVHGIALAWRQSDDLAEAGIARQNTRAVEAFLRAVARGGITLDRHSVVVVDELGLLGTRQLNALLRAQQRHAFQMIAIGDPRQMQSVEAGAVVDLLRRALGEPAIPRLETSIRQARAEERETVLMLRNGETAEAVRRKADNGTLRVVPGGTAEAIAGVVRLWQERRAAHADRPEALITISTPTNHDAHQISLAIRQHRRALGELGPDRVTLAATDGDRAAPRTYDLALAEGDKIRLFQRTNARFLDSGGSGNIGQNGTVLEIAEVREDGLALRTRDGRTGLVAWDTLRHPLSGRIMLAYGEVLTTNTTQGATVTEHIFALPEGSRQVSAFGAYTSGSRHREMSFIVTSDGAERQDIAGRRPLGDRRPIRESDVIENITRNFARQPVKESALALLDRAETLRTGTVRRMQAGKQGLEQRDLDGRTRATLAGRFARRRDEARLRTATEAIATSLDRQHAVLQRLRAFGAEIRASVSAAVARLRNLREGEAARATQRRRRAARP